MIVQVYPVYDPTVRSLCVKPYPLHPRGCPNFNHKDPVMVDGKLQEGGCPPKAPCLPDVFDLAQPCYAIINPFDIGVHVEVMRRKHPEWSERQLACCLYWQPRARKMLEARIAEFVEEYPGYIVSRCPEAMGLNVTETLRRVGVPMEWPPVNVALQVAFAGKPASTSRGI